MNDGSGAVGADDFSLAARSDFEDGLSDDLRARVKRELEPAERLLWAARSDPPLEPHPLGFYVWSALALMILGLGLYLLTPPRGNFQSADGSAITGGVLFVGVAFLIVVQLFREWSGRRREWRRLSKICYAVTNRRVISWIPQPRSNAVRVEALGSGSLTHLVRIESPDGSGNLELGKIRFAHIPEVRRVEQIVRNNLMTNNRNV